MDRPDTWLSTRSTQVHSRWLANRRTVDGRRVSPPRRRRWLPGLVGLFLVVVLPVAGGDLSAELSDLYLPQLREIAQKIPPEELWAGRQLADSPPPTLGQRLTFYVRDEKRQKNYSVPATLIAFGKHSLWYRADVEPKLPASLIHGLVAFFDDTAIPRMTETFGEYKGPHPEGDTRVTFLLLDFSLINREHAVAFVHPLDLLPPEYLKDGQISNQRKLIYLNTASLKRNPSYVRYTLGHEYVHLILRSYDLVEETWVSEGLAELGTALCGGSYYLKFKLDELEGVHDQPLIWNSSSPDSNRDYAIAYLWNHYLYCWTSGGKNNFFRQVVADQATGLGTYLGPLHSLGLKLSDMYAAFWVASFFNDRDLGARFYYDESLSEFRLSRREKTASTLPTTFFEQLAMGGAKGLTIRLPADAPAELAVSVVHPFNMLQTPDPTTPGSQDITAAFILKGSSSSPRVIFRELSYDKTQEVYRTDLQLPIGGARSLGVVLSSMKSLEIPASWYEHSQEPFGICLGSNDQALAAARSRMTLAVLVEEQIQWYLAYTEQLNGQPAQKEESLKALEGIQQEVVRMIRVPATGSTALECFLERIRQQPPARRKILHPLIKKVRDFVAASVHQGNDAWRKALTALDQILSGS